jgi:hypothetical protein
LELVMNVRSLLGDAGLAILLALPTATLAGPAVWPSHSSASTQHAPFASAAHVDEQRFSLPR